MNNTLDEAWHICRKYNCSYVTFEPEFLMLKYKFIEQKNQACGELKQLGYEVNNLDGDHFHIITLKKN